MYPKNQELGSPQCIDSKSYSINAMMTCLYTIRGYTQYLPTGKYTNSSLLHNILNSSFSAA